MDCTVDDKKIRRVRIKNYKKLTSEKKSIRVRKIIAYTKIRGKTDCQTYEERRIHRIRKTQYRQARMKVKIAGHIYYKKMKMSRRLDALKKQREMEMENKKPNNNSYKKIRETSSWKCLSKSF